MFLLPKVTEDIRALLAYIPLPDMPRDAGDDEKGVMAYADQRENASVCVFRTGRWLFCGGAPEQRCLCFIRDKILTFEIYEKYGVLYLIYPDETWRAALRGCFSGKVVIEEQSLGAALTGEAALSDREPPPGLAEAGDSGVSVLRLDFRSLHRGSREPTPEQVQAAARRYVAVTGTAQRVPEGASTYVYRVPAADGICYARFLPEDASFGPEVLAHRILEERGVAVPRIIAYESREAGTGLSMMLTREVPGYSMEKRWPGEDSAAVLREAGRQLRRIHDVPVQGFGWIDRNSPERLRAEKDSFLTYFWEYTENDLMTLRYYDCTDTEREAAGRYMREAARLLDTEKAVLAHGDFDVSHIFHRDGRFTGFIDFGEIRGNHPFFDLAAFALSDASEGREATAALLAGYGETAPLTSDDLRAVELMGLSIALRFAGKKVETASREYWLRLLKGQLQKLGDRI